MLKVQNTDDAHNASNDEDSDEESPSRYRTPELDLRDPLHFDQDDFFLPPPSPSVAQTDHEVGSASVARGTEVVPTSESTEADYDFNDLRAPSLDYDGDEMLVEQLLLSRNSSPVAGNVLGAKY